MTIEAIFGLVTSGISVAGIATGWVLSIRKARKELQIVEEKEAAQEEAKLKAEKEKFYLTAAANLVVSADKLSLTGPQKKEYVMTWLENEAGKAGIEVDKALMSVAIERTILIMNDFKDKDAAVSDLLTEELDESVAREQAKIDIEAAQALADLNAQTSDLKAKAAEAVVTTKDAVASVKDILGK